MKVYEAVQEAGDNGSIVQIRLWTDPGFEEITGRVYYVPFGPNKPKTWREFTVPTQGTEDADRDIFRAISKNISILMQKK